jgi:hypothetical protein
VLRHAIRDRPRPVGREVRDDLLKTSVEMTALAEREYIVQSAMVRMRPAPSAAELRHTHTPTSLLSVTPQRDPLIASWLVTVAEAEGFEPPDP